MHKPSRSSAVLILLSSTLALMSVACSRDSSPDGGSTPTAAALSTPPSQQPVVSAKVTPPNNQTDTYDLAIRKAESAVSISTSASSSEDWKLVVSRWQQAIKLMQAVPANSPNQGIAKTKLAQYQKNLAAAKQKASPSRPQPLVVAIDPTITSQPLGNVKSSPKVVRAPIKYRLGGTPVIDVTFNGSYKFAMILDTGASGVVITPGMAAALGVQPVGKMRANTPSAKAAVFEIGFVDSIAVGSAVVRDVQVAIAPQLDVGLLGQDFFASYDITIRRDVIEFHLR